MKQLNYKQSFTNEFNAQKIDFDRDNSDDYIFDLH